MLTKNRLPLVYDKSRPARFGILPKRPKSGKDVVWFELPSGITIFNLQCDSVKHVLLSC